MQVRNRYRALVFIVFVSLFSSLVSPVQAADIRIVDVAAVTWPGARAATVGVSSVESAIKNEVGPRWKRYTTIEGSLEDKSIDFRHGVTLSEPISLIRPMGCEGSDASSFMNSVRQEAYKRLGISDWAERYLVILTPDADCIWSGRALIGNIQYSGGVLTLQDNASAFIIVHELGHTLGLGHSNFLRCDSGKNDGPWGSDCKAVEYGGTTDVMGNVDVDTPLSTYNQWQAGYLQSPEIKQSWLSEKIELTASDVAGPTRAVFLRDGKSTYWVEYRRADAKATYKPGLVIYRTDPPPISAVVSPNPEDSLSPEFDSDVAMDFWMLNWDNYTYVRSKANGSMTLPEGKTATVFSGNISLSAAATSSPNKVVLSVVRKADTTPPPAPELIDPSNWKYPESSIIKSGFDDGESTIASFEADIAGKIVAIGGTTPEKFVPTYLSPFTPVKTVYLRDLPEGDYSIAIRAIDIWGNKGAWSKTVKAYVDRGNPIVSSDFTVNSIDSKNTVISWTGVKDEGIGLCSTVLHNPEGFVFARSTAKSGPSFTFNTGTSLTAKAQVFDCLGNGMSGEVSASTGFVAASTSKRTGKWSTAPASYGAGALKCTGKCTASVSIKGNASVLLGETAAEIFVSGKSVAKIPALDSKAVSGTLRNSPAVAIGAKSKVLRITGSNFVFGGISSVDFKISEFKPMAKSVESVDTSLEDPIQRAMSRFGFNAYDFTQEWTVLPMARGTTLLDPTLDLCGANYQSESGRETRRQLSVIKLGSPYLFLSSEAVKYRSVAAANAALAELKKNFENCVKNKGGTENGVFLDYAFENLPKSNAALVDESSRVLVRATIGKGDTARNLLAFYQYNGQYFTGLYVVSASNKPLTDAEILRWFDVAGVLADRLKSQALL
ncbi:MAG: hypothetical protein RL239_452 [Actinomycetota bacterium]